MNNTTLSIIITAAMYAALIGYSVWRVWYHRTEPIFERRKCNMTQGWFEPVDENYLRRKLTEMQSRRAILEAELVADYSPEKLRKLNELDHHIEVTENRLNGSFNKTGAETSSVISVPKTRMQPAL